MIKTKVPLCSYLHTLSYDVCPTMKCFQVKTCGLKLKVNILLVVQRAV